jgi:hypothetical protein
MTVNDFYRNFLSDRADYGFDVFSRLMERREVEMELWHPNEQGVPFRLLKSVIPVKGVPFLSSTRHRKTFKLIYKDETRIVVEMENRSLDIPYADVFYIHEKWHVISDSPKTAKCMLR